MAEFHEIDNITKMRLRSKCHAQIVSNERHTIEKRYILRTPFSGIPSISVYSDVIHIPQTHVVVQSRSEYVKSGETTTAQNAKLNCFRFGQRSNGSTQSLHDCLWAMWKNLRRSIEHVFHAIAVPQHERKRIVVCVCGFRSMLSNLIQNIIVFWRSQRIESIPFFS